jgi:hypothetical protein
MVRINVLFLITDSKSEERRCISKYRKINARHTAFTRPNCILELVPVYLLPSVLGSCCTWLAQVFQSTELWSGMENVGCQRSY